MVMGDDMVKVSFVHCIAILSCIGWAWLDQYSAWLHLHRAHCLHLEFFMLQHHMQTACSYDLSQISLFIYREIAVHGLL